MTVTVGGHRSCLSLAEGNTITEIGACYIHGASEENPVFCLARDYGLLNPEALTEENRAMDVGERPPWVPNWFSSSGQKLRAEQMNPAKEMFVELLKDISQVTNQEETQWASIGHFIRSEAPKQAAERWKDKNKTTRELLLCAISTMLKVECCDGATNSMGDVDLVGYAAFKNLIGLDCTLPCGFEGLIEKLMSELPSGSVSYNQPVRCVHWNDTGSGVNAVTVECDDGERVAADHVIVTIPLGYLKKHHSTLFCPPLPANKLHSIQKLGFGTCNKIFVEFESPWWDPDCEIIYLLWEDEKDPSDQVSDISKLWIRKMASFTVLPPSERNSHVLCGWIAGHESEYMETLSGQEVRRSITELVRTFTGNPTITPRRISCSRWFHDPWTCGSYSHAAVGSSAQDLENMMEPLPLKGSQSQPLQVLFAGEATHPYHYSTVHGALLSGRREADRLIAHYSPTSSQVPASALAGGFMFFCLYVHFSVSCQVAFALDFDYERKMIEGIKTPYL
ncbi:peroxisomal N(1)-acetyl-spermine/spermidine oxidase-like isoform X3 [Scophthalmus maximus]|uniref:Polyamine oxidase n=1 Tax=Scophthalmus maximus TaxID=52904 RepID=A0A8D2ZU82_SCOMX|nr:peroxisomal N(1)-acetyl-spermine/spermidine oxidase-like isoform X3 [Scophthalmus maximus]